MIKAKPFSLEEMLEARNPEALQAYWESKRKSSGEILRKIFIELDAKESIIDEKHSNQARKCDKSF